MSRYRTPASMLTVWMIHGAFIFAVPVYLVIYAVALPEVVLPQPEINPALRWIAYVLLAMAFVQIPLGIALPNILANVQGRLAGPSRSSPGASGADRGAAATVRTEVGGDSPLRRVMTDVTISDAFFEAIAIYGLVGRFVGMAPAISYALMGLSFALLVGNSLRIIRADAE